MTRSFPLQGITAAVLTVMAASQALADERFSTTDTHESFGQTGTQILHSIDPEYMSSVVTDSDDLKEEITNEQELLAAALREDREAIEQYMETIQAQIESMTHQAQIAASRANVAAEEARSYMLDAQGYLATARARSATGLQERNRAIAASAEAGRLFGLIVDARLEGQESAQSSANAANTAQNHASTANTARSTAGTEADKSQAEGERAESVANATRATRVSTQDARKAATDARNAANDARDSAITLLTQAESDYESLENTNIAIADYLSDVGSDATKVARRLHSAITRMDNAMSILKEVNTTITGNYSARIAAIEARIKAGCP